MLSDSQVKSLKIEDGKRYADRDGLVLEIRKSKKKVFLFRFQWHKSRKQSLLEITQALVLLKRAL